MCIVLFTTAHPDYSLILIDNRDEFILRPTSRPHWWKHPVSGEVVLSSRDLQRAEKGTWLGITRSGRFAVLTNYRETNTHDATHPVCGLKSRGGMVTAWLAGLGDGSIQDGVHQLVKDQGVKGVGGFSMVCGKLRKDIGGIAIVSNRAAHVDDVPIVAQRRDETHGLSNTMFDSKVAWPKVDAGKTVLDETIKEALKSKLSEAHLVDKLFGILDQDTLPPRPPDTSFEETVLQLKETIFVPPLGNEAAIKEMSDSKTKGLAPWEEDESSLRSVEEILADQDPAAASAAHAANGFSSGLYGTQRQTVILVDLEGNVKLVERALWDRNGNQIPRGEGDIEFSFQIEGWEEA